VGTFLVLFGAACAPLAPRAPPVVGLDPNAADPKLATTPVGPPRMLMDEYFVHPWPDVQAGRAWLAEDGYRLSARQPGAFVAVRAPLADVPRDVIVSGTFRKVGGPSGGGYGLILDDQGSSAGDGVDQSGQFLVAAVGDRGEVGIWRRDGQRWTDLVPWTPSSAVHTNTDVNDLSVQLIGGRLTFRVNGARVADLASPAGLGTRPGRVGIFTGGDLNEVVVNRFRVQSPGRPVDLPPTPSKPRQPSAANPPRATPDPSPALPDLQHVRDLLVGIAEDIVAIAESFSGGLDNPHDPVLDPLVLQQDRDRLAAATRKANELRAEMDRVKVGEPGGR
jgi:hypothetical protein